MVYRWLQYAKPSKGKKRTCEITQRSNRGEIRMSTWSPLRVTVFLQLWNLLMPLKFVFTSSSFVIYAGLWTYLPNNPFSISPFIVSLSYAGFMFPFYLPGIVIASYVWHCFKNTELTRYDYISRIMIMQVIYVLLIWILIPCPISTHALLCIPVPSTGIVALLFTSRVIRTLDTPWIDTTH